MLSLRVITEGDCHARMTASAVGRVSRSDNNNFIFHLSFSILFARFDSAQHDKSLELTGIDVNSIKPTCQGSALLLSHYYANRNTLKIIILTNLVFQKPAIRFFYVLR